MLSRFLTLRNPLRLKKGRNAVCHVFVTLFPQTFASSRRTLAITLFTSPLDARSRGHSGQREAIHGPKGWGGLEPPEMGQMAIA